MSVGVVVGSVQRQQGERREIAGDATEGRGTAEGSPHPACEGGQATGFFSPFTLKRKAAAQRETVAQSRAFVQFIVVSFGGGASLFTRYLSGESGVSGQSDP